MGWLYANIFMIALVAIFAGFIWLVGFSMWRLGLPPDDHPLIASIGILLALLAAYFACKKVYAVLQRFIR
jgi:cation transporter-like permease